MSNPNESEVERIILEIEQQVFSAIETKDTAKFALFLDDDFVYRSPDGSELVKDEFLRNIAAIPVEIRSVTGLHQKVTLFSDVAVLTGVQKAEWRQDDGSEGVSSVAFTDVFARRGERWLMVLAYGVEIAS